MTHRPAPAAPSAKRSRLDARLSDAGLAVAVALVISVVIAADPVGRSSLGGYLCAAGFGGVLLLRRRFPRLILAVTIVGIFAYYTAGFPPIGMVLPAVGALYSAAEMRRTAWAVGAAAVLIAVASFFRMDGSEPAGQLNGYTFVTELALAAAAIALGAAVRLTREARERSAQIADLTAAEEAHAADARMHAERVRIARDLHDTIGHTLSVASLHAGVAAEATGRDDEAARTALDRVRAAMSDALRELRRTVKVLRDDTATPMPVLGLAALDPLFAAAREAGLHVETELDVASDALSPAVDATAYRTVQEALTNVLRHADATTVHVTARAEHGLLALRIVDDGRGSAASGSGTGAGIRGMRERVALLGGTVTARAAPGGFAVMVEIPVQAGGEA
ncbi:sensor histidine kinase [Agromyces laixinhei]|uniref:sensor histidine kinase n=1 Tax=Agromyces laixinhei TaxID=2585717 RepID=UPI0012EDA786|nr:sensor histidine kinase [Agromyces laixinhei]